MYQQQSPYMNGHRGTIPATPFKAVAQLNQITPHPHPRQFGLTTPYPYQQSPVTPIPLLPRPIAANQNQFRSSATLSRTNTALPYPSQPNPSTGSSSNSWETTYVSCNKCLKPVIEQRNVMTPCYHVFCVTCANHSFSKPVPSSSSSTPMSYCPVCNFQFNPLTDVRCISSNDSDAKEMAKKLCSFSPKQLLEIFTYAIKFWQFQLHLSTKQRAAHLQTMIIDLQQHPQQHPQQQQEIDHLRTQLQQKHEAHQQLGTNYQSVQQRCEEQEQYINKLKAQLQMTSITSASLLTPQPPAHQHMQHNTNSARKDSNMNSVTTQQRSYQNNIKQHSGFLNHFNNNSKNLQSVVVLDDDNHNPNQPNVNMARSTGHRSTSNINYQNNPKMAPISTHGLLGDRGRRGR